MTSGEILAELVLEGDEDFQSSMDETSESMEQAGQSAEDASQGFDEAEQGLLDIDEAGAVAGGAIAGVGAGMQKAMDDSKQTRQVLNRTAVTMGVSSDEANRLARSMSDANTPIGEVSTTMSRLAEAGVTSESEMKRLTETINEVGNATGMAGDEVSQNMGRALRAMGKDMKDAGEEADTFTFIANETSLQIDEFADGVREFGPELREMGLSFKETAGLMSAMQAEGIQGEEAMTRLGQAIDDGASSQEELANKLGISQSSIQEQTKEIKNSKDLTEDYAEANNQATGTMDKLRSGFQDTITQVGGMLQPLSALAPALMAVGSAQSLVATINFSTAIPSFVALATSMAPIIAIALAIGAVIAVLAKAWSDNWFGIRDKTKKAIGVIKNVLGKAKAFIGKVVGAMVAGFKSLKNKPLQTIKTGFNAIISFLTTWSPLAIVSRKVADILAELDVAQKAKQAGKGLIRAFVNGIKSLADLPGEVAKDVAQSVRDKLPGSDAEEGPLSDLTASGEALPQTFAVGMEEGAGDLETTSEDVAGIAEPDAEAGASGGGSSSSSSGGSSSGASGDIQEVRLKIDDKTLEEVIKETAEVLMGQKENSKISAERQEGIRR